MCPGIEPDLRSLKSTVQHLPVGGRRSLVEFGSTVSHGAVKELAKRVRRYYRISSWQDLVSLYEPITRSCGIWTVFASSLGALPIFVVWIPCVALLPLSVEVALVPCQSLVWAFNHIAAADDLQPALGLFGVWCAVDASELHLVL